MRDFFSRPQSFSFKDLLAVGFSGFFLFQCGKAVNNSNVMELIKTLVPLIAIILGGYFGQEISSVWVNRPRYDAKGDDNNYV